MARADFKYHKPHLIEARLQDNGLILVEFMSLQIFVVEENLVQNGISQLLKKIDNVPMMILLL